jgi:hypothetical protein
VGDRDAAKRRCGGGELGAGLGSVLQGDGSLRLVMMDRTKDIGGGGSRVMVCTAATIDGGAGFVADGEIGDCVCCDQ